MFFIIIYVQSNYKHAQQQSHPTQALKQRHGIEHVLYIPALKTTVLYSRIVFTNIYLQLCRSHL